MTILVVGPDDQSARLARTLSQHGFAAVGVSSAAEARPQSDTESPELVLCVLDTEDDGDPLSAARTLLADRPWWPVVLVTAHDASAEILAAAMQLGVRDLIVLGHDEDGLAARVAASIERIRDAAPRDGEATQHLGEAQLQQLDRDQRAGRHIQMGMLPPSPMAIDRYRLRHKLFPSLLLSGDFVDYFRITDHHFAFYMADVSGHGASSAFVTVLLKNFSRRLRREYRPRMLKFPGEVLAWLNRELLDNQIEKHVAMFLGVVDTSSDRLAYANGGHFPPPILCDQAGVRFIDVPGKPVGLFRDPEYASLETRLAARASLFLVSDGVLELMDVGSLASKEQRLLAAAEQCHASSDELWQVLEIESRLPGPDDVSCLTVSKEA